MYEVLLEVRIDDPNEAEHVGDTKYRFFVGRVLIKDFPFVPVPKMHVGSSQLLTMHQVYWLGDNKFKVFLGTIQCCEYHYPKYYRYWDSAEILMDAIKERTSMPWEFEELKDEEE